MQFIKVGNRVINLNAIALVDLEDAINTAKDRVRIDLLVSAGQSEEFGSEPLWFADEAEMNALRQYFSNPSNVVDLLA